MDSLFAPVSTALFIPERTRVDKSIDSWIIIDVLIKAGIPPGSQTVLNKNVVLPQVLIIDQ